MQNLHLTALLTLSLLFGCAARGQHIVEIRPTISGTAGELRFVETDGAASGTAVNYVGFKTPAAITADVVWTLPAADGTSGQALVTNGSGVLSWGAGGGGGASAGADGDVQMSDGSGLFTNLTNFNHDGDTFYIPRSTSTPTTEGAELYLYGGSSHADWVMDVSTSMLRFITNSGSDQTMQLVNVGAGSLDMSVGGDVLPAAGNTYTLGSYGGAGSDGSWGWLHTRDINAGRIRIGIFDTLSFVNYHRWEPGAGTNLSHIENNSGVPILSFDSAASPQVARVQGNFAIRDVTGTRTSTFVRPATGSDYSVTLPNAQGTGALTNDGAGNLSWSAAGSFTCTTANNCVNLDGAQTITGAKTLQATLTSRTVEAEAGNTYSIGSYGGAGSDKSYANAYLRDIRTGRVRVGIFDVLGTTDYHRWEAGAGSNLSHIENNAGVAILSFNSAASPQVVTVGGTLKVGAASAGFTTGTWSGATVMQTDALAISTSGSFYIRTYTGGDVNCATGGPGATPLSDGWMGYRLDTNQIQICDGGAVVVK